MSVSTPVDQLNQLWFGDNLDVLRNHIPDESVDLIYLDPPFNSDRSYNILFSTIDGDSDQAQIRAFDDSWLWGIEAEQTYDEIVQGGAPLKVVETITALRHILGDNNMLAYLVMMTARFVELHRVLKPTGSIYVHCDQTASHYLKIIMDSVFGVENFLNNVVWLYALGGSSKRYWPKKHDDIFWYSKVPGKHYFDAPQIPATANGREGKTKKALDWWYLTMGNNASERLGYPTQKPVALLERIVESSSRAGDVVLDPFCGCGTTIEAAEKLGRRWIGIDITYLAINLIQERITDRLGAETKPYEICGIPKGSPGAQALFERNPFEFERWAVTLLRGQPNDKQRGDRGVDGVARFVAKTEIGHGRIVISVKGGKNLNPGMVRDLIGTLQAQGAELAIMVTLTQPTAGMVKAAAGAGTYEQHGNTYPRVQIITVGELLDGKQAATPTTINPYRMKGSRQRELFNN